MNDRERVFSWRSHSLSREPEGRPQNLIFFTMAGFLYLISMYAFVARGTVAPVPPLLGTVFALIGIAESLPATRQRTAFRLRLLTVLSAGIIAAVLLIGLLGGPQWLM